MSHARNFESVFRNARLESTWSVPMNVCSFFSMISITWASASWPLRHAAISTRTRSPLRACIELRSATKIASESSSVITLFFPFDRRTKVPVATLLRCGALNLPGAISTMSPSNASSASRRATLRWAAGVSAPIACDTCL